MAKARPDIKQEVTDRIIAALEEGTAPWVKGWQGGNSATPVNGASGRHYNGVNVLLLWLEADSCAYTSNKWYTYKQAAGLDAQVRKGEKGTKIVFWNIIEKEDEKTGELKKIFFTRYYTVFNADQIDGLEVEVPVEVTPAERHARADALIVATQADVIYGRGRACYAPSFDRIEMPAIEQFEHESEYYSTHIHELAHWTGAKSRLDRDLSGRFGSASYAMEELVAELSAAFVCAEIGIDGKLQHAEYISSWVAKLKEDKNAIFTAASAARKASDYLTAFEEEAVEVAGLPAAA